MYEREKNRVKCQRYRQKHRVEINERRKKKPRNENPALVVKQRQRYRDAHRDKLNQDRRDKRKALRMECFNFYGGKCACCGEKTYEFLSFDHIHGQGEVHRREIGGAKNMALWLKKNNFPSGFRVLCHNCNMAIGVYGYCPHAKNR